ncbi:hypothetical protein D3C84_645930 [compost metagenome]
MRWVPPTLTRAQKSNTSAPKLPNSAAVLLVSVLVRNNGMVCPTPTTGTTDAITVRSSVARQMSLQPINQPCCQSLSFRRASTSLRPTQ